MSGFGTLIYTDCRPGQGLDGGAGLQFQAVSEDVDGDAMAVVQRHLLYEPPSGWMRDQRPVEDYPPSFAHVAAGCFATAAGVYLGREANGTREGNQLTHAVTTRDPGAYGLLRPAQLYGASFWTGKPAGTTRCEAVPADPPPGRLDTEVVHEFVSGHPDGPRLLAALLTVLSRSDDGQAPQVLFIADQVEPVLTWTAAATLLLPHRQALGIGFKVFTTTPAHSAQRVLAVHPGWDTPPASVDRPEGYLVVDLLAGRWSEIETSGLADRWAATFCAGDPFDTMDAVELAAASGLAPEAAASLARVAVLGEPPEPQYAGQIVAWLADGPPDQVESYGPAVAATFTADVTGQPVGLLRELDRATHSGRFPGQAVPVRLALLATELRTAAERGTPPAAEVPRVTADEWLAEHTDQARTMAVDTLNDSRADGFAAVLTVARSYGIPLSFAEIGPAAEAFVADWARRPDAGYQVSRWAARREFVDRLRDVLTERVERSPDARAIGDAWHRLLQVTDPTAPLDQVLIGARMAAARGPDRLAVLTELMNSAPPSDRAAVTALSECLWRWTLPDRAELRALLGAMRVDAELDAGVIDRFVKHRTGAGTLEKADLELVGLLTSRNLLRPGRFVDRLLAEERMVRKICAALPTRDKHDPALVEQLATVDPVVLGLLRSTLVEALLDTPPAALVVEVVRGAPVSVQRAYASASAERLKDRPAASAVATALAVIAAGPDARSSETLRAAVNKWAGWAGSGPVDRVTAALEHQQLVPALKLWFDLLDANKIRRGRALFRRPKGK